MVLVVMVRRGDLCKPSRGGERFVGLAGVAPGVSGCGADKSAQSFLRGYCIPS